MDQFLNYLTQKTTWAGIITFAGTVVGINIAPELATQIGVAGSAIASIVLVMINERK